MKVVVTFHIPDDLPPGRAVQAPTWIAQVIQNRFWGKTYVASVDLAVDGAEPYPIMEEAS